MTQNDFITELQKLNIAITEDQLQKFNKYYDLLIEYNKVMNLTSITKKEDVYLKHFYDSLTISKIINLNNIYSLCDIGTGAGFPGIVLKILYPNINITLIDSQQKRINFLNIVIKELSLNKIETIHSRIEEYGINNKEKFDVVTARAVAPLNILMEYSIPLIKINGCFIAMKGNLENEPNTANALKKLNCNIEQIEKFKLPYEDSNRTIIKIFKQNKTNHLFPRKYSEIKKHPL